VGILKGVRSRVERSDISYVHLLNRSGDVMGNKMEEFVENESRWTSCRGMK